MTVVNAPANTAAAPKAPPGPRGYDVIADELVAAGVECIFGLLGDDTAPLILATNKRNITYYPVRHENEAIAMADGYQRATGRIGVCTVTGGPGICNGLTALVTANRGNSRIVVLSGTGRPAEDDLDPGVIRKATPAGWLKWFPHGTTLGGLGIKTYRPQNAGEVIPDTRAALLHAENGPSVLVYGRELIFGAADTSALAKPAPKAPPPKVPDPEQINQLADLLQETWAINRPLIIGGRGAMNGGAGPALRRLGELTGALMATTLPANGLFYDDPFNVGVCGTYSNPVASELIPQADCVLAFGAALNIMTTYNNTMFPKAMLVHVDHAPAKFGVFMDPELTLEADVKLTAEALVAELERRGHQTQGFRTDETRATIAAFDKAEGIKDKTTDTLIDPRTMLLTIDKMLPRDRVFCADGGHFVRHSVRYMEVTGPRNFVQANENASIGLGIGLGLGAAVGRPDAVVMVSVGDTAMMMSLGDIESAVRLKLNILIVIGNDEALGAEVMVLNRHNMDTSVAQLASPSFEKIGAAMGAWAATVRKVSDLDIVEKWVKERPGLPLVLDVRVNPEVRAAA
jgi:acetolactate synthase-1/2/3 large subunit